MSLNSIESLSEAYDRKLIESISDEYGRLMDWFNKDFPEANIRLDVHQDKVRHELRYTLSILSGKEATPENQLSMKNTVVITPDRFNDILWMGKFKNSIYDMYKQEIIKQMNDHYNVEKEKNG